MCFSAEASFTASGVLAVIGVASWMLVRKNSQRPLAMVPFLFAIQQAFEGVLWLLPSSQESGMATIIMYLYLFFALGVWPIFIPYALMQLDEGLHKRTFMVLCLLGVIVGAYLLISLFMYGASVSHVEGHIYYNYHLLGDTYPPSSHNRYHDNFPWSNSLKYAVAPLIYLFLVSIPFFVIKNNLLRMCGFLVFVFAVITILVWYLFYTSIWCFFAAAISSLTALIIYQLNKQTKTRARI